MRKLWDILLVHSATFRIENVEEKSMKIPQHVAIILDGNGRWAKQKACPAITDMYREQKMWRKSVKRHIIWGLNI